VSRKGCDHPAFFFTRFVEKSILPFSVPPSLLNSISRLICYIQSTFTFNNYCMIAFAIIDDFLNLNGYHEGFTNPSFPYKPLKATEIRVIEVQPGDWHDNVEVSLSHVSLDDDLPYEALLSTWRDTNLTRRILVDGQELRVTENLEIGLRHLRAFVRITLWVDAICINQHDTDERAEQVPRMKSIYNQSTKVVVWLGPEANDSDTVMQRLLELRDCYRRDRTPRPTP